MISLDLVLDQSLWEKFLKVNLKTFYFSTKLHYGIMDMWLLNYKLFMQAVICMLWNSVFQYLTLKDKYKYSR